MIHLPTTALAPAHQASLEAYQSEVNTAATYPERVNRARDRFGARNRSDNATFVGVRGALRRMCSGVDRCMYCEDSHADEIEHFRPKDLYPELAFAWDNYLYACGSCNRQKSNRYELFSATTGLPVDVTRRPGAPIVSPESGDPLLIDPRSEDPLAYLRLDLGGSFLFRPTAPWPSREHTRALHTLEVLRLNEREGLRVMRANAFIAYTSILETYVTEKHAGVAEARLLRKAAAIRRMSHPTVWAEMRRQHQHDPHLRALFIAAREALDW